jgi:hypothetical protein
MRYVDGLVLVRLLVQRGLAAIYFIAFLSALNQFRALLGERGLLPVTRVLERARFLDAPSVFHLHYSDRFFSALALAGVTLSLVAAAGLSEAGPLWVSVAVWLVLWALYLSIVNLGQAFYSFGWESMLVEAGFFAAFLGPSSMQPSFIPILLLRWMLFRTELGAGLIKLRHDECWRNLTCLDYHHETQPLPNPLSWYFHRAPKPIRRVGVLFSHFVQLVVPFGLFAPQPIASIAGGLTIFHQLLLIVSGNYSWLNWLTVVLGLTAFDDGILARLLPLASPESVAPASPAYHAGMWILTGLTLALSVRPVLNLISREQAMNLNYNPLHLVNSYGAFGSVTRERYEIVVEGTEDATLGAATTWREYELKAKPGDPRRRPRQIAPYHLRLDWLMWFLPFTVRVIGERAVPLGYERWFLRLMAKLLDADRATLRLFRGDPFAGRKPTFVRARYYRYRYTTPRERRATGAWWVRSLVGDYLPPVSRADLAQAAD